MKKIVFITLGLSLIACTPEGVKKEPIKKAPANKVTSGNDVIKTVYVDSSGRVLKMKDGLEIHWVEEGEGESFGNGKLIDVDYAVYVKNGKMAHSTAQYGMLSVPFLIGFNMQTPGWDLALAQMKVGDSAEVIIPSKLGRGSKGYYDIDAESGQRRELIPPNADLILKVRVVAERQPTRIVDGTKVWKLYSNKNSTVAFNEGKQVSFSCSGYTPTKRNFVNTNFTMRLEDQGIVPGLKKALIGAKKADKMFILVPSSEAYGSKGYHNLVKPNQDIFYNVFVTEVN